MKETINQNNNKKIESFVKVLIIQYYKLSYIGNFKLMQKKIKLLLKKLNYETGLKPISLI